MKEENKDISLLVVSCDKYYDVLKPFTDIFEHFWPDCPIEKRNILLNHRNFVSMGWESISVGEDRSWSQNLRVALGQIETEFVLIFFEDMFLTERVDTENFKKCFEAFLTLNAVYLKLLAAPKPNGKRVNAYFGEIREGDIYRSTAPAAIFRIRPLLALLNDRENAWQFELNGSQRSVLFGKFYSVYESLFKFEHGIVRGKYLRSAYKFLQHFYNNNFSTQREIYTRRQELLLELRSMRKIVFRLLVPIKFRHSVRKIFKKSEY